ncbi:mediator complex subunit 13 C-terminal-domain-containing protein [Flammula alnicola]|nr:mediator complex subunit 13 C-terminal-domain-containing protein [Flammula alnicola]
MAAKPAPAHTHISDNLLASSIVLPPHPSISYALFKPLQSTSSPHDSIEQARRSIISRNTSSSNLLDPIFISVHVGPQSFIYLFKISHQLAADSEAELLASLLFDGLAVAERSSFIPPSTSTLLPNIDKRIVFSHFLDAVRSRIIDDIVAASTQSQAPAIRRQVKRFKNGFLMSQMSPSSDWEYKAITRPLIYCQLQLHFSYTSAGVPSHLIVHPMLLPTPFLDISCSLPLPPGAPITLLPYGTPAYFLASYTGPTAGLTKQFQSSLQGMGVGQWESSAKRDTNTFPVNDNSAQSPTFIIGWIKVENKQGEDKGITIIYPSRLCLLYIPCSTSRAPLDYIPELPAPLQPSPQVPPALPSVSSLANISQGPEIAPTASYPRRPSIFTSPTSESLHCFRALTLSKSNDLRQVATEVGGYVDAVARERERERERLKRERESGTSSSPKLARTTATTPASAPTPMSVDTTASTSSVPPPPPPNANAGPSSHPLLPPPQLQSSLSMQNFYPSPPQTVPHTVPGSDGRTSPVIEAAPAFLVTDTLPPDTPRPMTEAQAAPDLPAPPVSGTSTGSSYDPYSMDSTWAQSTDAYLGMDMDMDFGMDDIGMNFGMNMGSMANGTSTGGGAYAPNRNGMEFEDAFTDDDFSFFDRPARPAVPSSAATSSHFPHSRVSSGSGANILASHGLSSGTGMSPPHFGDILSGPGPPPNSSAPHNSQMWTPGGFMDGFTPRSTVDHNDSIPPDLLPSSPGQTPESHSAPATPNVHLEYDPAVRRPSTSFGQAPSRFEPIPFSSYHREADGKYAVGKFALPSPPAEEELPEYNAITDPRIGVVRKLIGVKRKTPFQHPMRDPPKSSPWISAHEDWEKPESEQKDDDADAKSEIESDEEEEEDVDETESPMLSRPATPPPSYLPLGPTLVHTQFQHSQLLPLSVPLRPPGAAVAPINLINNNPPPSVPTPVSPAATMVVENPIWAETWRANTAGTKPTSSVWSTDYKAVAQLLEAVPSLEAPLSVASLFELDTSNGRKPLQTLEAPMISIGKGDAVIQVLPTALRFWEKLGLDPKGGRKDISAFVLSRMTENKDSRMSRTGWPMSGKHFGNMKCGTSGVCVKDGLVPLRFDASFRKSLASFIASLAPPQPTLVVFLILPVTVMSLSSPVLRQILSVAKKVRSSQLFFQFIPEHHLFCGPEKSSAHDSALNQLSLSIYNRIPVPVDRLKSRHIRPIDDDKDDTRGYFMDPSFTLARPWYHKVTYVRAAHTSLDVLDRYTLLHVGYHLTACGKWIIAACVDQRGEMYELGVWLTQSPGEHEGEAEMSDEEYAVKRVWDFAMEFAKKSNVEWRVVFARFGVMTEKELNAWMAHLNANVVSSREQPPLHHTLIDLGLSLSFIPEATAPLSSPSSPQPHSSATPTILQPSTQTITSPATSTNPPDCLSSNQLPHPITILPQSSSILIRVPHSSSSSFISMTHIHLLRTFHSASYTHSLQASSSSQVPDNHQLLVDVTRNYHELAVLSKVRWKLDGAGGRKGLPFHLAAVDAMRMALDRDWDRLEGGVES